jgi:RNA 3'-terminal phosphate cyclase (ATP)
MATTTSSVTNSNNVITTIDGSYGEGGGQVLRNAISYATILGKNICIQNIRATRTKPGLRAQHLTGLQLCAAIVSPEADDDRASLTGCVLHSQQVSYTPSNSTSIARQNDDGDDDDNDEEEKEKGEKRQRQRQENNNEPPYDVFIGDTKTAGSICLLLQAALPVALLARRRQTTTTTTTTTAAATTQPLTLILKGGTNASMAPQYDYWERVFLPTLISQTGIPLQHIQSNVIRRGYFPKGGGEVHIKVSPVTTSLQPIRLTDRGDISSIHIRSYHTGTISAGMAQLMTNAALQELLINNNNDHGSSSSSSTPSLLLNNIIPTVEIVHETAAIGSGYGILIVAETTTGCRLAGSALGTVRFNNNNNRKRRTNNHNNAAYLSNNNHDAILKQQQQQESAKAVGREAAQELVSTLECGGACDEWCQDQLILFMALAQGESELLTGSLTQHTQTAIWLAQRLTNVKFEIQRVIIKDDDNNNEQHHHDDAAATTTATTSNNNNNGGGGGDEYGRDGRIPGKHRIRCTGIGFVNQP